MAFRESNIHAQARAVTGAAIAFVVLNVSLYLADLIIGRLVSGETLFGIVITISVISIIAIEYVNTYVLQELNFRTFFFLIFPVALIEGTLLMALMISRSIPGKVYYIGFFAIFLGNLIRLFRQQAKRFEPISDIPPPKSAPAPRQRFVAQQDRMRQLAEELRNAQVDVQDSLKTTFMSDSKHAIYLIKEQLESDQILDEHVRSELLQIVRRAHSSIIGDGSPESRASRASVILAEAESYLASRLGRT
jgi:hypothetical protein